MRLWHKDLIKVLPRQQLLGQWRECCAIAKNLNEYGTPKHLLVNRITDYTSSHFTEYCFLVISEMISRGYSVRKKAIEDCTQNIIEADKKGAFGDPIRGDLFAGWHNHRYLNQCVVNLQEKFDCGGITDTEWRTINSIFADVGFYV